MEVKIKIVVADDHPLLLEGIISVIEKEIFGVEIFKANNGAEALQLVSEIKPAITILDIEMPFLDGIEVAKKIRQAKIPTKIIFLTLHKERSLFNEINKLGIEGYVLKEFSINQIAYCIKTVMLGKKYYSKEIENFIEDPIIDFSIFTKSEINVLKLIAQEKTTKEIAEMLFVSTKTIDSHRYNICKKLNLKPEKNSLLKWVFQNLPIF
ncbi:MAG: response regulator transcription factor [Lutibacter sp.]|uniref:response regulator transcription factor n=1 Tax=Lutibacter sp. TaxID=1925666 RepID=UPI0038581448